VTDLLRDGEGGGGLKLSLSARYDFFCFGCDVTGIKKSLHNFGRGINRQKEACTLECKTW
jgi:hypothetical protein